METKQLTMEEYLKHLAELGCTEEELELVRVKYKKNGKKAKTPFKINNSTQKTL